MKKQVLMICSVLTCASVSAFGQAGGGGGGAGGGGGGAGAGGAGGAGAVGGGAASGSGTIGGAGSRQVPAQTGTVLPGQNTGIGSAGAGTTTGVAGGAGLGPAGNTTAGTANGTTINPSSGYPQGRIDAPGRDQLPPGLQNRQLPPGLQEREQLPPGLQNRGLEERIPKLRGALPNPANGTAGQGNQPAWAGTTNQVMTTNQAVWGGTGTISDTAADGAVVSGSGAANNDAQGGVVGAQPTVLPNQPVVLPPAATSPLTPATTARRLNEDRAFTAADQSLLNQIRRSVLPVTGGSELLAPVNFNLRHGVVTLTGTVPNQDVQQQVLGIVQSTPGVRQVINQLQIGVGNGSALGGSLDTGEAGVTTGVGSSPSSQEAPRAPAAPLVPSTGTPIWSTGTNNAR